MVPWLARQGNKSGNNGCTNILQTYAKSATDVELFTPDSSTPLSYLQYSEVLAAFPSGNIPQQPFEAKSLRWQLQSASAPNSKRQVHLAVLVPAAYNSTPDHALPAVSGVASNNNGLFGLQQNSKAAAPNSSGSQHKSGHSKQRLLKMASSPFDRQKQQQLFLPDEDDECSSQLDEELSMRHCHSDSMVSNPCIGNGHRHSPYNSANGHYGGQQQHQSHLQQQQSSMELERRKFTRNLLSANNKLESLERYKAIMSLIETCKRRLAALMPPGCLSPADIAWGCEPGASLMQSVLDVGEALASFGNCRFPEHSNEARAILAGDYRALLRQYLSQFGFMFAAPMKEQLSHDLQEEVQSVGSLLATRCEAYDLLYDQLVRHVGLEGRSGPSTVVVNHNSASANPNTNITANPTNTTTASSTSKSKAVNKGLGGAAIAAAGIAAVLMVKALRGGGGGGRGKGRRSSSSSGGGGAAEGGSSLVQGQRRLRIPKGKNGRELLLVSQLSACGDELRRAKQNDELLKDDWRLGRHVRLAWPPGPPVPLGYAELAPDACNVSQLLQEMYG